MTLSCIHLTLALGKFFTCTLQFSSECNRSYPLTWQTMLSPRIITFFVFSVVSSFHAVALGRLLLNFIDDCFCLVWSWNDTRELSQLWFSLLILLVELPFVCAYNIITICLVTNCPFISLKIFITVFYWFCNFFNWFKWIIYFWQSKSIFSLRFLTKIWFPLLRKVLWDWGCKFANNDSMMYLLIGISIPLLRQSFWSRYVYVKRNLLELRLIYTSVSFKEMLLLLK